MPNTRNQTSRLKRQAPVLAILVVGLLGFVFLRDHLSFDALAANHEALIAFRDANYGVAALAFVGLYALIVGLSLPGATAATLAGGLLFGLFPGVLLNALAATLGATMIFLAVRMGWGERLAAHIGAGDGRIARLKRGIDENQWSVLFLMRLVPVVPFFVANVLAALLAVPLWRFFVTTSLGILPAAFVYTGLGAGLGDVIATGASPDLGIIFTPPVLLPLLGLAVLAALPMLAKHLRREARS